MGALLLYVHIPQTEVNIPVIQGMLTYHCLLYTARCVEDTGMSQRSSAVLDARQV